MPAAVCVCTAHNNMMAALDTGHEWRRTMWETPLGKGVKVMQLPDWFLLWWVFFFFYEALACLFICLLSRFYFFMSMSISIFIFISIWFEIFLDWIWLFFSVCHRWEHCFVFCLFFLSITFYHKWKIDFVFEEDTTSLLLRFLSIISLHLTFRI